MLTRKIDRRTALKMIAAANGCADCGKSFGSYPEISDERTVICSSCAMSRAYALNAKRGTPELFD